MPSTPQTPAAGRPVEIAEAVRMVLAPNPSPMTFRGTNTWLVGTGRVVVIDPGPADARHLDAILRACGGAGRIEAILVTHSHRDHSPLAATLSAVSGAPVLAAGDSRTGRSALMNQLAAEPGLGGGEGVDEAFCPDRNLADGEVVALAAGSFRAIATPGHFCNHMSFALEGAGLVFTGDHVMGWASTLVSPPDGDVADFMASLDRLAAREGDARYLPGHGDPVDNPAERVAELAAHRRMREAQILHALADAPGSPAELAARIYTDTPPALLPAAARNVLAHLIDLESRGVVARAGDARATARYALAGEGA